MLSGELASRVSPSAPQPSKRDKYIFFKKNIFKLKIKSGTTDVTQVGLRLDTVGNL